MDDTLEAEAFSRELDKLLSGQAAEGGTEALTKDLELAARLSRFDLSGESRVRRGLRAELSARRPSRLQSVLSWLSVRPMARAACVGLAMLLVVPVITHQWSKSVEDPTHGLKEGWDIKPVSSPFASGSSPHDRGIDGMAPGAPGGSAENGLVINPLNVRDPKGLAFSKKFGSMSSAGPSASPEPDWKSALANASAGDASPQAQAGGMGYAQQYRERPLAKRMPSKGRMLAMQKAANADAGAGDWQQAIAKAAAELDREGYDSIVENAFQKAADHPLSTFSIDVDAASYANVRRFLTDSVMPPKDAVRIEELINYFRYDYPEPAGEHPFSITTELAACPWKPEHKLVRIGLKGKSIPTADLPPNNLVFLIDSSGSMMGELPLVKSSLRLLVDQLRERDRIAIVTYAGSAGLVLPPTSGDRKAQILAAIDGLEAGGSTAGGHGIQLAYATAAEHFLKKGNNRVILATDGDFNVGVTSDGELVRLIEEKRKSGVFLTVLGFGRGNYQDAKMEKLADKGNGNYAYVDDILEARKVLVTEMGATLLSIAKDVKLQVEFNPGRVSAYRLIGYENRMLAAQDFNDDKKDAGELGAGHTVTALYEVIPAGIKTDVAAIDELKYQRTAPAAASAGTEMLTVKFRYKRPDGDKSLLLSKVLEDSGAPWTEASPDFKFAASVAGFGMLLRGSEHAGNFTYKRIAEAARENAGKDEGGYRAEFLGLVERAKLLDQSQR